MYSTPLTGNTILSRRFGIVTERLAGSNLDGSAKARPVAETPMTAEQTAALEELLSAVFGD